MTTVAFLEWGIRAIRWALVAYFGLFLYKKFKLPSLPWIGAYFLAAWLPKLVMPFIINKTTISYLYKEEIFAKAASALWKTNPDEFKLIAGIINWTTVFNGITYLLLTLLVISEVIFFISSKTDLEIPKPLAITLSVRKRVNLVGLSVVFLTLMAPLFTIVAVGRMPN